MQRVILELSENFKNLSDKEKRVAEYILEDPSRIVGASIGKVAERSGTSKATVVRLCKQIGCRGYKEFSVKLNTELSSNVKERYFYKDVHPGEGLECIAESVSENGIKAIKNTLAVIDYNQLERAVSEMACAQTINFYGAGGSSLAALDAQNKMLRIGKLSFASSDTHLQILSAIGMTKGDVAVIVSSSGETLDTIEVMKHAKNAGAFTIAITGCKQNTISAMADVSLYTDSNEGLIRSGAMTSRIGILTIIDILYSALTGRLYANVNDSLDKSTDAMKTKRKKT